MAEQVVLTVVVVRLLSKRRAGTLTTGRAGCQAAQGNTPLPHSVLLTTHMEPRIVTT